MNKCAYFVVCVCIYVHEYKDEVLDVTRERMNILRPEILYISLSISLKISTVE